MVSGKGGLVILGFSVMWVAYSIGWAGWVMVKRYNVPLVELVNPLDWYSGKWPPEPIPATRVWPEGKKAKAKVTSAENPA